MSNQRRYADLTQPEQVLATLACLFEPLALENVIRFAGIRAPIPKSEIPEIVRLVSPYVLYIDGRSQTSQPVFWIPEEDKPSVIEGLNVYGPSIHENIARICGEICESTRPSIPNEVNQPLDRLRRWLKRSKEA